MTWSGCWCMAHVTVSCTDTAAVDGIGVRLDCSMRPEYEPLVCWPS